jgi:uncharacterized protein (TIGR00661 family)
MVNILYGVCGEGMGHASRSRILIEFLSRHHDVRIVAGGKAYLFLSQQFPHVEHIESAQFIYKNDQVHLFTSILRMGYRTVIHGFPSLHRVQRLIIDFKPDIVLTDADPISHYAAHLAKLPRIAIDNPSAMLYRPYTVTPQEFFSWLPLFIGIKLGMYNAHRYLIYDFFDNPSRDPRAVFLKPLIQEGLRKQKPRYGNHLFVYQSATSPSSPILRILQQIDKQCIIYGFNQDHKDNNLAFRKFNETKFYRDLATAEAVITNGGFTVLSEALFLNKPIFSVPLKHQFEQILNGRFIQQLGMGEYHMQYDIETLQRFLNSIDTYKRVLTTYNPGHQEETLHVIEQIIHQVIAEQTQH